jgi:dienelactone hydrolase
MRKLALTVCTIGLGLAGAAGAQESPGAKWDLSRLSVAPEAHWVDDVTPYLAEGGGEATFTGEGVKALFYEGLPWKGNPTRVFAWYGVPEHDGDEKVPAMVVAHGGGGTAFDEWVRVWNRRGYAAISMDLTGSTPGGKPGDRPRHEWGGPPHLGDNADIDDPVEDQWVYHAVADIVLAHSLLRSFPEVDADRIGLTGISWGGFLTSITAAVDSRFRFACPVYGCGFIQDSPAWQSVWEKMGEEHAAEWHDLWDPSQYVAAITIPTLWVNGANDSHYTVNIHGRTYAGCGGDKNLCIKVGMHHSHVHGWKPQEIYAYADSIIGDGAPYLRIINEGRDGNGVWAEYDPQVVPVKAELVYTVDVKDWVECEWQKQPAEIDAAAKRVRASLPEGCAAYFLNLTDDRSLGVSTNRVVVVSVAPE